MASSTSKPVSLGILMSSTATSRLMGSDRLKSGTAILHGGDDLDPRVGLQQGPKAA